MIKTITAMENTAEYMITGYIPPNPATEMCLIQIPIYAQMITVPYAISLFRYVVAAPIISPTTRIKIVQKYSSIPKPSNPKLTSNVVVLAMVAIVIHPK